MSNERSELRLAVLIDADNAPRTALRSIMAEAAVYGVPTVKRIYGDWTTPNMSTWKPLLLEHAISPVQQYSYTTGKNSTDSAMIIDAMDLLYSGRLDGFVLVSSDSDFTRLALRLREAGMKVYGMGERKTPEPFRAACDKFIYIEVIRADQAAPAAGQPEKQAETVGEEVPPMAGPEDLSKLAELISASLESIADEDGYVFMGELGNFLQKKYPDFDPRNYGFSKLTPLIKRMDRFEIDVRPTSAPGVKHIYLRDKGHK